MSVTTYSDLFASLAQIQDEHAALVKEVGANVLGENSFKRAQTFVRRCVASGMVLDASADRAAAQSLITYWVGRLDRAVRDSEQIGELTESEDVMLEEFDQDAFDALVIIPTEKWLAQLSPSDRLFVQRIVLRLLNLRADGSFETIPNTRTVLEGLEPQERANEILLQLIRRGVVRRVRHSLEFEEYSLQPLERLKGWASLQTWMEERRSFRELATAAVKHGLDHRVSASQVVSLTLSTLYYQALRLIGGLRPVLVTMDQGPTNQLPAGLRVELPVTEAAIEEAENYRDKNADEVKFIYQKRQLDKQRLVAAHERLVGITVSAIGLAILAAIAFIQWRSAVAQRTQAQNTVKSCSLRFVNQQFSQAAMRLIEDPSGAMLFAAEAISKFEEAQTIIQPPEQSNKLRDSYLLTLAGAEIGMPIVTGMAFRDAELKAEAAEQAASGDPTPSRRSLQALSKKTSVVLDSGDACLLLTLRPTVHANGLMPGNPLEQRELVIQFGHNSTDGSWTLEPERVVPVAPEHLEPDSAVSAYVDAQKHVAIAITSSVKNQTHLFYLSADGADRSLQLVATLEPLADAEFSPDGQYFGIAIQREQPPSNSDGANAGSTATEDTATDDADESDADAEADVRSASQLRADPKPSSAASDIIIYRTADWVVAAKDTFAGSVGPIAFAAGQTGDADEDSSPPARFVAVVSSSENPKLLGYEWQLPETEQGKLERIELPLNPMEGTATDSVSGTALVTYCARRPKLLFVSDDSRGQNIAWLIQTDRSKVTPLLSAAPAAESVPVTCAAFSPDGNYLAVGRKDGRLEMWSLSTDQTVEAQAIDLGNYAGHSEQIFGLGFSSDSKYLATGSRDKKAMVLDVQSRRLAATPLWHSGTVNIARFTPDGRHVTTLTKDVVYTWELPRMGSPPLSIAMESGRVVRHRSVSHDGKIFVVGGTLQNEPRAGWVRAWNTDTGQPLGDELQLDSPAVHVAVNSSPQLVSAITEDGAQLVFDEEGRRLWKNPSQDDRPVFAALGNHQDEPRILVIGRALVGEEKRTTIRVFRFDPNQNTFELKPVYEVRFDHDLSRGQFDKDCQRFVAYSDEGRAIVGEIASRDKYQELSSEGTGQPGSLKKAHSETITHAEFSSDGSRVVTTSEDDNAIVWIRKGTTWERHLLDAEVDDDKSGSIGKHTANINFASFDAFGERVVTASADGRGIVWRWNLEHEWYEPYISIQSGSTSKGMTRASFIDERYVLGAWDDAVVRIWDTLEVTVSDGSHTWELHGREVASFKPAFAARMFYGRRSAEENSFTVTAIGRESRTPGSTARELIEKSPRSPTAFKISRWELKLPSTDVSDQAFHRRTVCVARMLSARQIADDPLQLEPLPLKEVLQEWQNGCRPSKVLKHGHQGLALGILDVAGK